MVDLRIEVIVVKAISTGRATVMLPDASEEDWSLASLPAEVQPGDRVGILVEGGQFEIFLLNQWPALQA